MSAAKSFVDVNGIRLCTDPARESCFKVVWKGSEMAQFEDELSLFNYPDYAENACKKRTDNYPDLPTDAAWQLLEEIFQLCIRVFHC